MRKINEIFHSLQGEGAHTGVPVVFVRFSGCNKKCWFCDTDHNHGTHMTDDDIAGAISQYDTEWVVLTGGEPAMFIDDGFIDFLHAKTGRKIAIETNGSLPVPETIDWVTVSPKSGFDGAGEYPILVGRADEVKVVDINQDLGPYLGLGCVKPWTRFYLQPCHVDDPRQCNHNLQRTIDRVMADPRWTLSVQLHRYLGIQ